jgi:hypothetical protein
MGPALPRSSWEAKFRTRRSPSSEKPKILHEGAPRARRPEVLQEGDHPGCPRGPPLAPGVPFPDPLSPPRSRYWPLGWSTPFSVHCAAPHHPTTSAPRQVIASASHILSTQTHCHLRHDRISTSAPRNVSIWPNRPRAIPPPRHLTAPAPRPRQHLIAPAPQRLRISPPHHPTASPLRHSAPHPVSISPHQYLAISSPLRLAALPSRHARASAHPHLTTAALSHMVTSSPHRTAPAPHHRSTCPPGLLVTSAPRHTTSASRHLITSVPDHMNPSPPLTTPLPRRPMPHHLANSSPRQLTASPPLHLTTSAHHRLSLPSHQHSPKLMENGWETEAQRGENAIACASEDRATFPAWSHPSRGSLLRRRRSLRGGHGTDGVNRADDANGRGREDWDLKR